MIEINIFDMLVRFSYSFATAFIIIRFIYFKKEKKGDYIFTFFMFNLLIFFVCSFLKSIVMNMGFAFGLFAIFSILRYRTETIPIREMTYQFLIITLGAINGLADAGTWHPDLLVTNLVILLSVFILENSVVFNGEYSQSIVYEKIELIKPECREELIADLKARTGLKIHRIKIDKISFLRDTADIAVFYREENGSVKRGNYV